MVASVALFVALLYHNMRRQRQEEGEREVSAGLTNTGGKGNGHTSSSIDSTGIDTGKHRQAQASTGKHRQ